MFTGIITDIGSVRALEKRGDLRARIGTRYDTRSIEIGASIACSGVCLTVVDKGDDWFDVDISAETLTCSSLGDWVVGSPVNLERALKVGDELGGHIVTGHVDVVGRIETILPDGDSRRFTFSIPAHIAPYIVEKGSVCLNGVSLTVNEVEDLADGSATFGINIIPHTQENTSFGSAKGGDAVNVEIDVLARYVARLNARA
ncbi:riboflavin synthase [Govanella unica]|uniref:Riboflavin synthase n=1 Tax=Govanella unica TaxID=2975056 RepID=A0A9X3Z7E8_9PROT|nr:riboflavin synthase [Govania unica]MDA5194087.1 riboflavin synthase [Govania unica]